MLRALMPRLLVLAVFVVAGCTPVIGDPCVSSIDCSFEGDRICDVSYPEGYCTVANCDRDTCPDDAACVQFRYELPRLATSACMASCEDDGDCRDQRFRCVSADQVPDAAARVLDTTPRRFCVAVP
jgi:hypothetical protein